MVDLAYQYEGVSKYDQETGLRGYQITDLFPGKAPQELFPRETCRVGRIPYLIWMQPKHGQDQIPSHCEADRRAGRKTGPFTNRFSAGCLHVARRGICFMEHVHANHRSSTSARRQAGLSGKSPSKRASHLKLQPSLDSPTPNGGRRPPKRPFAKAATSRTAAAKKHTVRELIDKYVAEILPNQTTPRPDPDVSARLVEARTRAPVARRSHGTRDREMPRQTARARVSSRQDRPRPARSFVISRRSRTRSPPRSRTGSGSMTVQCARSASPKSHAAAPAPSPRRKSNTLLAACKTSKNPHLYLIALLAVSTGMRLGEILTPQTQPDRPRQAAPDSEPHQKRRPARRDACRPCPHRTYRTAEYSPAKPTPCFSRVDGRTGPPKSARHGITH